jgi:hypothetical protein
MEWHVPVLTRDDAVGKGLMQWMYFMELHEMYLRKDQLMLLGASRQIRWP